MDPVFSPDASVRVDWEERDGRMSHVIQQPTVVWAATNERILSMGWDWDGNVVWVGGGNTFLMHYRRYAQGGSVSVWVDPAKKVFRIGGADGRTEPLADIHRRLEEAIEAASNQGRVATVPGKLIPDFLMYIILFLALVVSIVLAADRARRWWPEKEPAQEIIREIPRPTKIDESERLRTLPERLKPPGKP